MNAPAEVSRVDVLAVLGTQASMARVEGRNDCGAELDAARAAVAELIAERDAQADELCDLNIELVRAREERDALAAALALAEEGLSQSAQLIALQNDRLTAEQEAKSP